jgi:hypothetical protein
MYFIVNSIIIPNYLSNMYFVVPTTYNNKFYDNLIVDLTLPQQPAFSQSHFDVFTDAAIFFSKQGMHYSAPSSAMKFELDGNNLQVAISSFTVNQVIESVLQTGLLRVPITHSLVRDLSGFELTTLLMFAVVPELWYNYGTRNMTLEVIPLSGTQIKWNAGSQSTNLEAKVKINWKTHEDAFDKVTTEAFESVLDLDIELSFSVDASK